MTGRVLSLICIYLLSSQEEKELTSILCKQKRSCLHHLIQLPTPIPKIIFAPNFLLIEYYVIPSKYQKKILPKLDNLEVQ